MHRIECWFKMHSEFLYILSILKERFSFKYSEIHMWKCPIWEVKHCYTTVSESTPFFAKKGQA